jgi:2-oxoglutarate/2-oxoacid ferredoxin oxidoreductase subunit alpha
MKGGQYVAEGLEHSEDSAPAYSPEIHMQNMDKRARKVKLAAQDAIALEMYEKFGDENAPVAILGWGSTIGPVREAVERAQAEGLSVAVMYIKMLHPLPNDLISDFIKRRQIIIVPELNYTGQFARMIQAQFWREVVSLRQYGGVPFTASEVYNEIKRQFATLKSTKNAGAKRAVAPKRSTVRVVATRKPRKAAPKRKTAQR